MIRHMKVLYLASRKHRIPGYDITYNDIVHYPGIDICCDMLQVDLSGYDVVIATPPCNYYSRANWRRETSDVAQLTKHLLPDILKKLETFEGLFIVENVLNDRLLPKSRYLEFNFGQHHFYTNVFMFLPHKSLSVRQNKQYVSRNQRDGNYNVDLVLKVFLTRCKEMLEM